MLSKKTLRWPDQKILPLADTPLMVYYIAGSHSNTESAKYFSIGWSYPTFLQKYPPQIREE
jgi:hypothetical protein